MIQNQIFNFALIILIMVAGADFMARSSGHRTHASYRRIVGNVRRFCWQHITRFVRWAWHEYSQFIVGLAVGILLALYFTGHFQ